MKRSLTMRLMLLFSLLLAAFTVLTAVIYNALMVRQSITHHSQAMQRDAFAIAQNLSELVAPSAYDASLDETRFIVSEENLPPYLALTEQLTRCNVYLVDSHHNVTGYFDGVVQVLEHPLLAGYLEQSIALGFMGKTPIIHAEMDVLAQRLEEARRRDEQHRLAQQRLFSGISHELKTPVTVIRGSLEALRDGVVSGEAVSAYYAQMIGETRWLQHLIRDLLELSRLQSDDFALDLAPVDLSELLSDVAMSARALCTQKGLTFACEEPSAHPQVMGDYSRLRQMLMIAVDNAVKFTPPGRGVRLWLDEAQRSVSVADEGPGIPAAEVPLIFERFHHTRDPSHEGAGLGLAIAAEIARRHGVTISVASEEGRGTVFTFAFPSNEA